jgi:hypothetical protein
MVSMPSPKDAKGRASHVWGTSFVVIYHIHCSTSGYCVPCLPNNKSWSLPESVLFRNVLLPFSNAPTESPVVLVLWGHMSDSSRIAIYLTVKSFYQYSLLSIPACITPCISHAALLFVRGSPLIAVMIHVD